MGIAGHVCKHGMPASRAALLVQVAAGKMTWYEECHGGDVVNLVANH